MVNFVFNLTHLALNGNLSYFFPVRIRIGNLVPTVCTKTMLYCFSSRELGPGTPTSPGFTVTA